MKALVLEEKNRLAIREVPAPDAPGKTEVRIKVHTVGICGSDVHYYKHGRIGPFVLKEPMILGHEASGTVTAIGSDVEGFSIGDRVCMEPGIPDPNSRAARLGLYNVDPSVRFWATPPVDGCLTGEVNHPAAFVYKLPDNVSFSEGAMVEPFAIGLQAAVKADLKPGDCCVVLGAGPIGMMCALAALAGGASRVYVADIAEPKLSIIAAYDGIVPVHIGAEDPAEVIMRETGNWGADVVFECSGAPAAILSMAGIARPGGRVVLVGMPVEPAPVDIVALQAREITVATVFRYANVYDRAIALLQSGKVDLKPLITAILPFEESIAGFERAAEGRPDDVKLQIAMSR